MSNKEILLERWINREMSDLEYTVMMYRLGKPIHDRNIYYYPKEDVFLNYNDDDNGIEWEPIEKNDKKICSLLRYCSNFQNIEQIEL